MGMRDLSFQDALAKAEHLKALGQTTVYLDEKSDGLPWSQVAAVEAGGLHRFSGPVSCYMIAEVDGLTFKWSVDFEPRDANGRGTSIFDRSRLRDVIQRIPAGARKALARMLAKDVLPCLEKHTAQIREALNSQLDSEDCVRGLIAFANEQPAKADAA